ncbi:MAG: hypothetical protein P8129_14925, partial [Anaerolineae bacterium]
GYLGHPRLAENVRVLSIRALDQTPDCDPARAALVRFAVLRINEQAGDGLAGRRQEWYNAHTQ